MRKGQATVVKNAGSHFMLSELPEWNPFPAVLKGKVRLKNSDSTNPVAVGDRVIYEVPEDGTVDLMHPATISEVLDRKNWLVRKSTNLSRQSHVIAANIDMAYIIVSLYFPEIKLPFLDRILVSCEVYGVPVTIVMNKVDLYREEAAEYVEDFHRIYEGAGYRVIETSVKTGEGIDTLREDCKGKVCLFSGESGVGKSSLVNAIDPSLDAKVGRISTAHLHIIACCSFLVVLTESPPVSGNHSVKAPFSTKDSIKQVFIFGCTSSIYYVIGSHYAPGMRFFYNDFKGLQVNLTDCSL